MIVIKSNWKWIKGVGIKSGLKNYGRLVKKHMKYNLNDSL